MSQTPITPNPFAGVQVQASASEPLPPNAYYAKFVSVEPFSNDRVQGKLRWRWEVASGTCKGREASALTDTKITAFTQSGRLLAGLLQRQLVPGEDMAKLWADLQACVGKAYMVTVQAGPKGGKPSVQAVSLPPEM